MKNICFGLVALISIVFISCQGDQGPPGVPGINGSDGGLIVSSSFEKEIDFNAVNSYQDVEPYGFQVLPSDVTLVYILWEVVDGKKVWRLLPQTVEFNDGVLVYNYDFTSTDVRIFLEGSTDFNILDPSFTQDQIFRVVVVPADNVGRIDYSNLNAVMEAYGIETFEKR